MEWISGKVVAGHGVASGRSRDSPYPDSTIRLQAPFFLRAGVDLSVYFPGTLNIDLAPLKLPVQRAERIVFDGLLHWFGEIEEHFILSRVEVRIGDQVFQGLWYYPHPATKPAHFQRDTVVEVLLPFVKDLTSGDTLAIRF